MEGWTHSACKVRHVLCNVRMSLRGSQNFLVRGLKDHLPNASRCWGGDTLAGPRVDLAVARGGTRIPQRFDSQTGEGCFCWLRTYPFLPPSPRVHCCPKATQWRDR